MRRKISIIILIFGMFLIFKTEVNAAETYTVKNIEEYYNAIDEIHSSSNEEFTIILDADIDIDDASKVKNNTTIDNGNTVTIIGNNHKIHFSLGSEGRFRVSGATLNLGSEGEDSTLTLEGPGTETASYESILTINNGTVNMYDGVTLKDNRSGNGSLNGGAVRLGTNGKFIMNGGLITNNSSETSSAGGGAIMIDSEGGEFIMNGGVISNNYAGSWGGAVLVYMTGTVTINGGTFKDNEAAYGGAIATIDRPVTIKNATFEGNEAAYGGALLNYEYYGGADLTVSNSKFYNNSASSRGGAILGWGTELTVEDSIITSNTSANGGGVYLASGSCDLSTTSVYNNKATTKGNDYYIAAGLTDVSIIEASDMDGYATYGDINTNLLHWYSDDEGNRYTFANPTDVVNATDVTAGTAYALTASGDQIYIVTFETNGGNSIEKQIITVGNKIVKPTDPTRQGKVFVDWYKDEELTQVFDFDTVITGSTKLYAKWETAAYSFTTGANQEHIKGDTTNALFEVNADSSLIEGMEVYIDGALLDTDAYTTFPSNSRIILKAEFLNTLELGEHTIKVEFTDGGKAQTKFLITSSTAPDNPTNNPDTGSNIIFYIIMLGLSSIGVIFTGLDIRKRKLES